MSDDRELDDLTNLLKSPGWQRFVQAMTTEWGDQITRHLETAVNDTNDALAANKMRQVIAAKKAIDRALLWPGERVRALEHQPGVNDMLQLQHTMSRGGY